jgi:hypothetical protein
MMSYGHTLNYETLINKAECGTLIATHSTHTLEEAERHAERYNKMDGLKANVRIKVSP